MRINLGKSLDFLITDVLTPNGSISNVETLLRSIAVLNWQRVVLSSILECLISNLQATMIGNVLTLSQTTIGMNARKHLDIVVEINDYLSTFLELLSIFFSPPVFQVTVLVILTTLVIKSVSHLMTNHYADGTIVEGIISLHIEEGILQNTSREANLVGCWVVVCIHSLRSHQPLGAIYWLTIARNHISISPLSCTLHIFVIRIILDIQCRIVLPLVRIANLYGKSRKLLLCLSLGGIAHPVKTSNTLAQCLLQVAHQLSHTSLSLCREIFLYIHLTNGFTQHTANHINGALPTRLLLLHTTHGAAIEVKVLCLNLVAQCVS